MSMNWSDVYGLKSDVEQTLQPTSVGGPTQGSVAPPTRSPATGNVGAPTASTAFSFLTIVLILIIFRVLYEMGARP